MHGIDTWIIDNLAHNLIDITIKHIGEVDEQAKEKEHILVPKAGLKQVDENAVVEASFRIDSACGTSEHSAHVRLTVTSQPTTSLLDKRWSVDAHVVCSEKGTIKYRYLYPLISYFEQCSWRLTTLLRSLPQVLCLAHPRTFAAQYRRGS
ncbi:hypothetical protein GGR55DRAFT_475395 [Xylaria sp. FL0064]|nr:hypothetical protein GGR55DRAFT_475395 [Xylaria sp. FL0064]